KNNIIYQNGHAGIGCYAATGSGVVVDHNLVYGNGYGSYDWLSGSSTVTYTLGTTVSADPKFANNSASGFDAHLSGSSPGIGAGLNLSAVFTTDFDGATRVSSGAWDLGSYVCASANTAPTITTIASQTVAAGTSTGPLAFTVGDAQTAASSLTVSGTSSSVTLVPNSNIVFGGSGSGRTVTVTPASGQSGTATITLTVSDGSLRTTTSFTVTVNSALAPVVTLTSPVGGTVYAAPATFSLAASVTANGHTITKVQFYSGTTLLGEDTATPYTFSYGNVAAGSYALSARVVYDAGSTVSSASAGVTVTATSPPAGGLSFASPSGAISAPFYITNSAICQPVYTSLSSGGRAVYTFTAPSSGDYLVSAQVNAPSVDNNSFFVNIDAEPTDPPMIWDIPVTSGLVSRTASWRGNGTIDAPQFAPKVFTLSAGTHQLIVRGREGNCQLGTITIAPNGTTPPVTNAPPVVTLASPANGASYTAPASISLSATVTDNGHTITKVQFYNSSTLLGEDAAAPYSFAWNNVGAGTYALSATAVYDTGNTVTTPPASVTVNAASTPPVVTLSSPANGATYVAPAAISLAATVTANGHTITKVQFYSGSTLLGEDAAAPYSFAWNNVGAGTYALSATAVYDTGSTVASPSANVTVTTAPPASSTVSFASTSGTLSAPFYVTNSAICQPAYTSLAASGRAAYSFTIPTTGDYLVSALVNAPTIDNNSLFVNIDAEPTDPLMVWDVLPLTAGFASRTVSWRGNGTCETNQFTPKVFNLAAGTHQLIVRGREGNCQLGTITIAPAAVLPAPWQARDVGAVGLTGSSVASNGSYTVAGAGNIGGTADAFRLVYQSLSGDGEIRAQLNSIQSSGTGGCAGVMVRESLTSGSEFALMGLSPAGSFQWLVRSSTSGSSTSAAVGSGTTPNTWVRVMRTGDVFYGYWSTDGLTWTSVGSTTNVMAANIYVGLAVASGATTANCTATFSNVTVVP
ncbi:MAG TPA: Ig-like domain-containing protein, partial [Verrucomicrobiae bacterium]